MTDEAFVPQRDPHLLEQTDEALVRQFVLLDDAIQATRNELSEVQRELTIRLEEREATAMLVPGFDVTYVARGSRQYDPNKVRAALGELLDPESLRKLIRAEFEETVIRPERVDGNEANRVRKLGKQFDDALNEATLPRRPVLTITPKEASRE